MDATRLTLAKVNIEEEESPSPVLNGEDRTGIVQSFSQDSSSGQVSAANKTQGIRCFTDKINRPANDLARLKTEDLGTRTEG